MNSPRCASPGLGVALVLLTALVPATLPAAGKPARTIESTSSPVRDHHLFVGVDPFLIHEQEMLAVRRFHGPETVLQDASGTAVVVNRDNGFQFKMQPKVSAIVLQLDHIEGEETFSPWTDPTGQWMTRQMAFSGHFDDQMTNATRELSAGMGEANYMESVERGSGGPSPNAASTSSTIMSQAVASFQQTKSSLDSFNSSSETTARMNPVERELEGSDFDAINLRFAIAAPEPVAAAHALARIRIRTRKDGFKDISFQRDIGSLDHSPRSILMTLAGLPKGYEFVSADIHIFHQGVELATTRSERLMPLTATEAREYLMLDHLAQHRDETLPAHPVWSLAPGSLRSVDNAATLNFSARVELDEQGQPQTVAPLDGQILPEAARIVFERLTYLPALEDGQPVSSTLIVSLADYFR